MTCFHGGVNGSLQAACAGNARYTDPEVTKWLNGQAFAHSSTDEWPEQVSRPNGLAVILRACLGNLELVSGHCLGALHHPGRELDDGMRGEARRETPGADVASDLLHPLIAVNVYEIDRKLHEKGVYGLTGNDPKPLSGREVSASQQALVASGAVIGELGRTCELGVPGKIGNSEPEPRIRVGAFCGTFRKPAGEAHSLTFTPEFAI